MTNQERQDAIARLLAGKLYLEEFGWRQHDYGTPGRPACASGALFHMWSDLISDFNFEASEALRVPMKGNIPAWNDAPGRTKAQVLRAFEKAIAHLEAGE